MKPILLLVALALLSACTVEEELILIEPAFAAAT